MKESETYWWRWCNLQYSNQRHRVCGRHSMWKCQIKADNNFKTQNKIIQDKKGRKHLIFF